MPFTLRDSAGQKYPVEGILRIGRDPGNQIIIQDQQVSRSHCTLSENQNGLFIRDENTANGTYVNQTLFQGSVQLKGGDSITIGSATFIVEQVPEQMVKSPPPVNPACPVSPNSQISMPPLTNPPPAYNLPPVSSQPVAKKSGISPIFPLIFIILVAMVCPLPAIGGYLYYKAPQAEKNTILNYFGKGPATIQLENFSDNTVYIFTTSNLERTVGDESTAEFEWETASFETQIKTDQNAGVYRIDFGSQVGDMDLGTCIFNLMGGEIYHFVVIPDHIIIDRTEYPEFANRDPDSVTELDMSTSSLCQYTSE